MARSEWWCLSSYRNREEKHKPDVKEGKTSDQLEGEHDRWALAKSTTHDRSPTDGDSTGLWIGARPHLIAEGPELPHICSISSLLLSISPFPTPLLTTTYLLVLLLLSFTSAVNHNNNPFISSSITIIDIDSL